MANHLSAQKAIRQTVKKTMVNKNRVSRIKTCIKKVLQAVASGQFQDAEAAFVVAQSEIMKGVTKKVIKFNAASRQVARLSRHVKSLSK